LSNSSSTFFLAAIEYLLPFPAGTISGDVFLVGAVVTAGLSDDSSVSDSGV
jgi:hypothetical protein